MKNSAMLAIIGIMILLVGGFVFVNFGSGVTGKVIDEGQEIIPGETQKATLSQNGLNYADLRVKAGQPIELTADSSVGGCLRSVVFRLNGKAYSKYLKTPSDTIQLPALEKGTYTFSCTMGMGFGKLVVE